MPSQRKTEPPTRRRLRRARREGDVPVSERLIGTAALLGAALVLPWLAAQLVRHTGELLELGLRGASSLDALPSRVIRLVGPLLGAAALAALGAGLAQTGGALHVGRLGWQWARLSPRLSLGDGAARRGAAVAIASVGVPLFSWLAWRALEPLGGALAASIGDAASALRFLAAASERLLAVGLAVLALGALGDTFVAHRSWRQRLRMTREEVLREQRESEGDPGIKEARLRAHRELLEGAGLSRSSEASLVVLGHGIAAALRYQPEQDHAPIVLVVARGALATQLEALAQSRGTRIAEDAELAAELSRVPVLEHVPAASYSRVAAAFARARRPSA